MMHSLSRHVGFCCLISFEKSYPDVEKGIPRQLVEKIVIVKDNQIKVIWQMPFELGDAVLVLRRKWGE